MLKTEHLNIRVDFKTKEEFSAVSKCHGLKPVQMINKFMTEAINDEKDKNLTRFNSALEEVRKENKKSKHSSSKTPKKNFG